MCVCVCVIPWLLKYKEVYSFAYQASHEWKLPMAMPLLSVRAAG